jgi:hypothetical protein
MLCLDSEGGMDTVVALSRPAGRHRSTIVWALTRSGAPRLDPALLADLADAEFGG